MTEPTQETVTVAGVQCDIRLGDKSHNLQSMARWTAEARAAGASLVVFPECALTGYCFDTREEAFQYAESARGDSLQSVAELCAQHDLFVVYGYLEREEDKLYNSASLVGPQGWMGGYRKTHLPFLGVDRFTDPGELPYQVFDAGALKVGMLICYDCSFPEPNRCLALAGADVIALPTNWPPGSGCTADYVPNTRALENNVYYMAVNRVGNERGFEFIGCSKICDPNGSNLVVAQTEPREEMLLAEICPANARNKHRVRVPHKHEIDRFRDRRPELYGPLCDALPISKNT